jgi:hypothetical protein
VPDQAWTAMSVTHKLTGYDRITNAPAFDYDVPRVMMYLARELAGAGSGGPDMLKVYVLNWDRAIRLGRAMEKALNTERYEWRLEPAG